MALQGCLHWVLPQKSGWEMPVPRISHFSSGYYGLVPSPRQVPLPLLQGKGQLRHLTAILLSRREGKAGDKILWGIHLKFHLGFRQRQSLGLELGQDSSLALSRMEGSHFPHGSGISGSGGTATELRALSCCQGEIFHGGTARARKELCQCQQVWSMADV